VIKRILPTRRVLTMGANGFLPSDIRGLSFDMDLTNPHMNTEDDQSGTFPVNGETIGYMPDSSNSGNDVSNSSASQRPTLNTRDSAFNNNPSITCTTDGWENNNETPFTEHFNAVNPPHTSVHVLQTGVAVADNGLWGISQNDENSDNIWALEETGNNNYLWRGDAEETVQKTTAVDSVSAAPVILIYAYDGTNLGIYLNGGTNMLGDPAAKPEEVQAMDSLAILGIKKSGPVQNRYTGAVARILLYDNDITDNDQINDLLAYLGCMYGISVTLPLVPV
jgi:hypothetical protein